MSDSLCRICGQPVVGPSMGGLDVCPWCDTGYYRDGVKWTAKDAMNLAWVRRVAKWVAHPEGRLAGMFEDMGVKKEDPLCQLR